MNKSGQSKSKAKLKTVPPAQPATTSAAPKKSASPSAKPATAVPKTAPAVPKTAPTVPKPAPTEPTSIPAKTAPAQPKTAPTPTTKPTSAPVKTAPTPINAAPINTPPLQNAAAAPTETTQSGTSSADPDPSINLDKDFQSTYKTMANGMYPSTMYLSRATGMEILHVEVPGPVVNCYIVLATYPDTDDGIPHCLEHLIFLGSEEFPYKGILDLISNKCMSSGTNAWTDSDHTCYTFETAGQDGFCALLPLFLEHIFHPTLEETAFLTEVHHITREGKDGGVVYSEMLANQHLSESKTVLELSRALYPTTSPYHYNSGGILKNLRTSCDNEKCAEFHKRCYTPKNLRIIICGVLDTKRLFKCLVPVTRKLLTKKYPAYARPIIDDVPATKSANTINLLIAADEDEDEEENNTLISVAFLGPSIIKDLEAVIGMRLLMEYFCDTAVAPFQLEFAEGEDALCNSVDGTHYDNAQPIFLFEFEGADGKNVQELLTRLQKVISDHAQVQNFDMIRMAGIIMKSAQDEMSSMENKPRDKCAYCGVLDFLYGQNNQDKFEALMNLAAYKLRFIKFNSDVWTGLIKKHFLEPKWITVVAEPSEQERTRLTNLETTRIQQRKQRLGDSGMANLYKELEAALAYNDRPLPPELLRNIAPKRETRISTHKIARSVNPDFINNLGCNVYLDDIDTSFIYVTIHMDTTPLSPQLRKYISIFREAFTESPMKLDNGQIIPFVDVVQGLTRDLNNYSFSYGIDGGSAFNCASFQHIFCFKAQMEMNKVDIGFEWIRKLLFNTMWDHERIKNITEKMVGEIKQMKGTGLRLLDALVSEILYKDDSNMKCSGFIRQEVFLKELGNSLPEKATEVEEALYQIKSILTEPQNMTIHIATSMAKLRPIFKQRAVDCNILLRKILPNPIPSTGDTRRLANSLDLVWMHTAEELVETQAYSDDCIGHKVVLGSNAVSSGYICVACPVAVNNFNHPDLCALETVLQYFCQAGDRNGKVGNLAESGTTFGKYSLAYNGPFARSIRGGGYAYDFWTECLPNEGMIKLTLAKCANTVEAFEAAKYVIDSHLSGEEKFDEELLVSAKSSHCFAITARERTPFKMSAVSLHSYYHDTKEGHAQRQIAKIQALTIADLEEVTKKYLFKLFAPNCICTVVCPNDRIDTVVKKFKKLGYKMQVLEKLGGCSPLAKWNV